MSLLSIPPERIDSQQYQQQQYQQHHHHHQQQEAAAAATSSTQQQPMQTLSKTPPKSSSISSSGGGGSSGRNLELKLYRQQSSFRFTECQEWLTRAWVFHFVACIVIISYGALSNHGERKYIPIDVEQVDSDCSRGFINVFASSIDDPGAFVCCNSNSNLNTDHSILCEPPPFYLLFAGRLSRFPDAWLLPLFPLFFRGFVYFLRKLQGLRGIASSQSDIMYAKRRFLLYIFLIQIRGWILYLLFDKIEGYFVSSYASTTTTGNNNMIDMNNSYNNNDESSLTSCWYDTLLPQRRYYYNNGTSNNNNNSNNGSGSITTMVMHSVINHCQGRETDFSDHIVLYYAQILPIALTEILHSFVLPYWENKDVYGRKQGTYIPMILLAWLANLYIITFMGAYKTSVYFHTGGEIITGYLISLLVQVPLFLLQCTVTFPFARDWFYGHSCS